MAKPSSMERQKLAAKEALLQEMRTQSKMKRDVTVAISSEGFYTTGLMCDVVQVRLLFMLLLFFIIFSRCITHIAEAEAESSCKILHHPLSAHVLRYFVLNSGSLPRFVLILERENINNTFSRVKIEPISSVLSPSSSVGTEPLGFNIFFIGLCIVCVHYYWYVLFKSKIQSSK